MPSKVINLTHQPPGNARLFDHVQKVVLGTERGDFVPADTGTRVVMHLTLNDVDHQCLGPVAQGVREVWFVLHGQ